MRYGKIKQAIIKKSKKPTVFIPLPFKVHDFSGHLE
jgi:hypothetical protein